MTAKKKDKDKQVEEETIMDASVQAIKKNLTDYDDIWGKHSRFDETQNFDQEHNAERAKILLKPEVMKNLEKIVDKLIAAEIDDMRK